MKTSKKQWITEKGTVPLN